MAWDQYGVQVAYLAMAPPLLFKFLKTLWTNIFGLGIMNDDFLILDILEVTKYDKTKFVSILYFKSSLFMALDQFCKKLFEPE